jgi:hypothetical protein
MSDRFDEDLTRWERGEISLAELAARHPDQDVSGLAALYMRLLAAGEEAAPAPDDGWAAVRVRLDAPAPTALDRGRRWTARTVAVAAALTLMTTGLALAIEPLRQGATWLFHRATEAVTPSGLVEPLSELLAPLRAAPIRAHGYEDRSVSWIPSVIGGDSLTCMLLDAPAHGRADVYEDCSGGWYRPSPDFHGADHFTYAAVEGDRTSDPATVEISLQPINDTPTAGADAVTTDEDAPVNVSVLDNDGDVDLVARGPSGTTPAEAGPANVGLTVAAVIGAEGSVAMTRDGLVYRPPADFHGVDRFRYTIEDRLGASDSAGVRIRVRPVNDPPVAEDASATGEEDSTIDWEAAISDVDGDALTCSIVDPPAHGQATVRADCSGGTYLGERDFNGTDVLTLTATDGEASTTAVAIVSVEAVNDPPTAEDVSASGEEDSIIDWVPMVSDVEGDPLTCAIADPPAHGLASVREDCAGGTYVPAANYQGDDEFTYTIEDQGAKAAQPASVKLTVRPLNDPPVAGPDVVTATQGTAVTIAVLSNDGDVDGDALSVTSTGPAGAGAVTANADGTITYSPAVDFVGSDSFVYTVSDPTGASAIGTVMVTVTAPPPAPPRIAVGPVNRSMGTPPGLRSPPAGLTA